MGVRVALFCRAVGSHGAVFTHTDEFINHILSKSVEGIRDGRQISYEAFKWLGLPYCDASEQEKIAKLFCVLNYRIEKQQQLVDALKKYKRGLLIGLLDRTVHFPDMDVSKWNNVPLSEIFSISAGGDIDRFNSSTACSNEYPYPVFANALTNDGLYGYANYYKIGGDSITVSGRGEVGHAIARHCKYVPVVRLLSLVPKERDDVDFFAYIINVTKIHVESTGVPQLTSPQLGRVVVPRPPIRDQKRISQLLCRLDRKIALESETASNLILQKQALLQQLFI